MEAKDLSWKEAYLVGDALIDAEHRAFFEQANAVLDSLRAGAGKGEARRFYDAFVTGLEIHFADEEALMRRIGYAGLDAHRECHDDLLAGAALAEKGLETAEGDTELRAFIHRLLAMLVEHLVAEDARYKPLVAKG